MIGIAFHLEPHYSDKIRGLLFDFYRETARSFEVKHLFVISADGYPHIDQAAGVNVHCINTPAEIPGAVVQLHPSRGIKLQEFQHPWEENVVYLCGPDNNTSVIAPGATLLQVETPANYPLWGAVAVGLVLYNRALPYRVG